MLPCGQKVKSDDNDRLAETCVTDWSWRIAALLAMTPYSDNSDVDRWWMDTFKSEKLYLTLNLMKKNKMF